MYTGPFFRPQGYDFPFSAPLNLIPLTINAEAGKIFKEFFATPLDIMENIQLNFNLLLAEEEKKMQVAYTTRINSDLRDLKNLLSNKASSQLKNQLFKLYKKELPRKAFHGNKTRSNWYIYHLETLAIMGHFFGSRKFLKEYTTLLKNYQHGR